jgi:tripartite-type tricarboxylate transporter receptor subunit TctC
VKAKLAAMAYAPIGSTPQDCAEFFRSEMAKWGTVIKEAGLKAE